jgi:hypothetical protein
MNGWMIIFGGSMRAILRPRHYDCERREAPAASRSERIFEYPARAHVLRAYFICIAVVVLLLSVSRRALASIPSALSACQSVEAGAPHSILRDHRSQSRRQ